jgi:hypothetical protein
VCLGYEVDLANYNVVGTRYGAILRKKIKKMEVSQHSEYFCEFCGKVDILLICLHSSLSFLFNVHCEMLFHASLHVIDYILY